MQEFVLHDGNLNLRILKRNFFTRQLDNGATLETTWRGFVFIPDSELP